MTCNLVSVTLILQFPSLHKMQCSIELNSRWTLQLINDISNDPKKLLGYFMEQLFLFFTELFVLLKASAVFPTGAAFYLNDWELLILKLAISAGTASLLNCYKRYDVSG